MAKVACPNCGTPCVGCAGAKLATASDGTPCCTRCLMQVEAQIRNKQRLDKINQR
jgi:hypothetical protein